MRLAVRDHFPLQIFGIVENGFAFLVGQRSIVLASKSNESFAHAHELLDFLSEVLVLYFHNGDAAGSKQTTTLRTDRAAQVWRSACHYCANPQGTETHSFQKQ